MVVAPQEISIQGEMDMKVYTLKFKLDDHREGASEHLQFEAPDMIRALLIAHERSARRSAELWDEARKLCTIRRDEDRGQSLRAQQA